MKEIGKKITDYIRERNMISGGENVLCAVSGGADSMCLLYMLKRFENELGIRVFAAHYEHGIRGEESLRDLRFVEDYCSRNGIAFVFERGEVPAYAAAHRIGMEEAARLLRYEFLEKTADRLNCSVIATAHNMDDNTETVLFNLMRGTGSAGLAGIPPVRGRIIRPLLCVSRSEIERCLEENAVPHVEDSTNDSEDYSRNRIRHKVLPLLRELSPSVSEAVFRASGLLREDDAALSEMAESFINDNRIQHPNGMISLPADSLRELPAAVASRAVRSLYGRSLSLEQTEAVLRLCGSSERGMADLPGGRVTAEQGRIYFPDLSVRSAETSLSFEPFRLIPGTEAEIPSLHVTVSCEKCIFSGEVHDLFNTLYIKCGEINGPVLCTAKMPGDRLRVKGRGCTKSLKSLFLEKKMTSFQRDSVLVFRDDLGILAVAGVAVSERAGVTVGDEALKISVIPNRK